MRIYLVGYMGSGKSKTAETLSKLLNIGYVDTDQLISEKVKKNVTDIFKSEGQEYFRKIEKEILRSTSSMNNFVISTGGGTPCFFNNMDWMNENGITVYLEANPGLLFHRLALTKKGRPLIENLNDVELMEQIVVHLVSRTPFYEKADIKISAASLNVKILAEKIGAFSAK